MEFVGSPDKPVPIRSKYSHTVLWFIRYKAHLPSDLPNSIVFWFSPDTFFFFARRKSTQDYFYDTFLLPNQMSFNLGLNF